MKKCFVILLLIVKIQTSWAMMAHVDIQKWDTTWQSGDHRYTIDLWRTYNGPQEKGKIELHLWHLAPMDTTLLWTYVDSLSCDWQDVVVYLDFDKVLLPDIDQNGETDIILVYTLDCTTDISPLQRHLVYYNLDTKNTLTISGWTLDPATPTLVEAQDLLFQPVDSNDIYNPARLAGKIAKNTALEQLPSTTQSHLFKIWMRANEKDAQAYE